MKAGELPVGVPKGEPSYLDEQKPAGEHQTAGLAPGKGSRAWEAPAALYQAQHWRPFVGHPEAGSQMVE